MKKIEFTVYVQPSAKNSEIVGMHDNALKIRIKDRPIEGKANDALISFLSDKLGIRKSEIEIIRGKQGRLKVIRITSHEDFQSIEEKMRKLLKNDA